MIARWGSKSNRICSNSGLDALCANIHFNWPTVFPALISKMHI